MQLQLLLGFRGSRKYMRWTYGGSGLILSQNLSPSKWSHSKLLSATVIFCEEAESPLIKSLLFGHLPRLRSLQRRGAVSITNTPGRELISISEIHPAMQDHQWTCICFIEYFLPPCYGTMQRILCPFSMLCDTTPPASEVSSCRKHAETKFLGNPLSEHTCWPWTVKAFRVIVTGCLDFWEEGDRGYARIWTVKKQERKESHAHALNRNWARLEYAAEISNLFCPNKRHEYHQTNLLNTSTSNAQSQIPAC
jgi:hypothetical protein